MEYGADGELLATRDIGLAHSLSTWSACPTSTDYPATDDTKVL